MAKNTNKHKYSMIVSLYKSFSFPPIPNNAHKRKL